MWIYIGDPVGIVGLPTERGELPVPDKDQLPLGKRGGGGKVTQNGNHNLVHVWFSLIDRSTGLLGFLVIASRMLRACWKFSSVKTLWCTSRWGEGMYSWCRNRQNSETGRIWFRRVRFQAPSSVSFFALSEFQGESSVSSPWPTTCAQKRTHRVFFCRTHPVCPKTQWTPSSETALSKQNSARFLKILHQFIVPKPVLARTCA